MYMGTIKVFISSMMSELAEERSVVEQTLMELDMLPNRFEAWAASPESPIEKSLSEVSDSEIFILILGQDISEPVLEEYRVAREVIPNRILAFAKKVKRSPGAEAFMKSLRHDCVYKTFRGRKDLGPAVREAIRSLMRDLLRRKDVLATSIREDSLIEETVELGPREHLQWEFSVQDGDYLSGITDEVDGDPLNIYLMNRSNYVKRKNGERYEFHGEEGVGAYEFSDIYVEEDGAWYLVLYNPARVYGRKVSVDLVRLSYE